MNNKDLRNLTEAYEQIFLKETGMEDMSRQDSREGFPSHEQNRYENEEEYDLEKDENNHDESQHVSDKSLDEIIDYMNISSDEATEIRNKYNNLSDEAKEAYLDGLRDAAEQFGDDIGGDEPPEMSDVDADSDALAGAGYGTDEDYGGYGESLAGCYDQVMIEEAKKAVSAKKNLNPWAIENALEKKTGKHFSKEKKERVVKGIKMGAKKYGKKITSKPIKKK